MFTPGGVDVYIKTYMSEQKREAEQLAAYWSLVQAVRDQRVGQPNPNLVALRVWSGRLLAAFRRSRRKMEPGKTYVVDVVIDQKI